MFIYFHAQGVLAVPPIPRGASYVSLLVEMSRACIHLGIYGHLVSNGICCKLLDMTYQCVANEVMETPTA